MTYSKAFKSYYQGYQAFFNEAEWRAKTVYERLQLGIKPWEWDHDNYTGDNADMVGFFYPEDLENIQLIDNLERKYNATHQH